MLLQAVTRETLASLKRLEVQVQSKSKSKTSKSKADQELKMIWKKEYISARHRRFPFH
jgi:hypothetical protein